jgi:hypothetical protein
LEIQKEIQDLKLVNNNYAGKVSLPSYADYKLLMANQAKTKGYTAYYSAH